MSLETGEADSSVMDASQAAVDVASVSLTDGLGLSQKESRKRAHSEGGDMKLGDGDPDKQEKRHKRLVRNREAAQQFRMRQKQHIIDMESKIKLIELENQELRTKVELLNSENKIVKDQLLYLRSFIGQAVSISMDKLPNNGQPLLPKDGTE